MQVSGPLLIALTNYCFVLERFWILSVVGSNPIASAVTQCSTDVAHCPVTERGAYFAYDSLGAILLIFVES